MILKLSVDRIENGIAVCYDCNDKKYELPSDGLFDGDLISAEFDGDENFLSAKRLKGETESRKSELASRTRNLFNRNKK